MSWLTEYLKETRLELNHVSWPTQQQAIIATVLVILISIGTSLYLGLADFLFRTLLQLFVL